MGDGNVGYAPTPRAYDPVPVEGLDGLVLFMTGSLWMLLWIVVDCGGLWCGGGGGGDDGVWRCLWVVLVVGCWGVGGVGVLMVERWWV